MRRYGNEPMVKTPTALLRNPAISSHSAVLYGLIAVYLSIEHTNPNHRRLALDMGVSVPTVRRALKELVDAGWVQVRPDVDVRGQRVASIYRLMDEDGSPLFEAVNRFFPEDEKRFVYFIQRGEDGPIKIGVSVDVAGRLRTLRAASQEPLVLLGTLPGGAGLEQALHDRFRDQRVRGEWFRPSPELLRLACGGEHLASTRIRGGDET